MHTPTLTRLWDTPEVAEVAGVSPSTVKGMRARGDGPAFIRVGRLVRYHPADVQAWLDERRQGLGAARERAAELAAAPGLRELAFTDSPFRPPPGEGWVLDEVNLIEDGRARWARQHHRLHATTET